MFQRADIVYFAFALPGSLEDRIQFQQTVGFHGGKFFAPLGRKHDITGSRMGILTFL